MCVYVYVYIYIYIYIYMLQPDCLDSSDKPLVITLIRKPTTSLAVKTTWVRGAGASHVWGCLIVIGCINAQLKRGSTNHKRKSDK